MGKAMRQMTLASQPSFEKYTRTSRREEFLSAMEAVVPWGELEALIEPHYPKAGKGRQPVGLAIMLRVYFLQQLTLAAQPRPTKRRFFASAACSKSMSYAGRYSMP